jgi:CDP-diglyceride synthetase
MLKRTLSALIGAPLLLGLTYLGGPYIAFLVAVLSLLALWEFMKIGEHMGTPTWTKQMTALTVVWLITMFIGNREWMCSVLVFSLLLALGRLALGYPKTSLTETTYNLLAFLYTVVLLSHLYLLRQLSGGLELTFLTFFLVWATDTGAYLIGKGFGRHPLAPQVSPKKTVEGSLGGIVLSVVVAMVYWSFFGKVSWFIYLLLAVIVGISAQIGDLFESALKRSAGVKDSGTLIPGHGGILDRFDSLIFAIPLVYYGVTLLVR